MKNFKFQLEKQVPYIAALHAFKINEHSFERIYRDYWEKVYGICIYHTRNEELSKGMAQEIFKSLWERRETLSIQQSIENYLLRSAKLKVCEHIRNKVVSKRVSEQVAASYCDTDQCTEREIAYKDLLNQVNLLVDTLPCQCNKIYKMSQDQGMSNKEIASALLITEKTVEYHLHKARLMLRKNLAGFLP